MPAFDPVRDAANSNTNTTTTPFNSQRRKSSLANILNDSPELDDYLRSPVALSSSPMAHTLTLPSPSPLGSPPTSSRIQTISPALTHSRPQSALPPPPLPTPPPKPEVIPYDPVRVSPPTSVLVPLSARDADIFKRSRNWLRKGVERPRVPLKPDPPVRPPSPLRQRDRSPVPSQSAFSDATGIGYYIPSPPAPSSDATEDVVDLGAYSPSRPTSSKRPREEDPKSPQPPAKRRALPATPASGDSHRVVGHYNARPDVGRVARNDSPIIALKSFNNWVKSVLIGKYFRRPPDAPEHGSAGRVLDMGCGKGGDLLKWSRARIKELIALDVAAVSVDQARARWFELRGPNKFDATFLALDCFSASIRTAISPGKLKYAFDTVSMQFCAHYAFASEAGVRQMLENVTTNLRPGGTFIGTIPDAKHILTKLADAPDTLSFGNALYKLTFPAHPPTPPAPDDPDQSGAFGHKYSFFLEDAVGDEGDGVPEYLVHWPNFERLAGEYGLQLVYKAEFSDILNGEREHPVYGPLLKRMKVVDDEGASEMDEEQWDAAGLYLAFAFEKR